MRKMTNETIKKKKNEGHSNKEKKIADKEKINNDKSETTTQKKSIIFTHSKLIKVTHNLKLFPNLELILKMLLVRIVT